MNCFEKSKKLKKATKGLVLASTYASNNRVSRRTVYNMVDDGRLCGVRIDGVLFVVN